MKNTKPYYIVLFIFILFFVIFFLFSKHIFKVLDLSILGNSSIINEKVSTLSDYNIFNYKKLVKDNAKLKKELLEVKLDNEKLLSLETEVEDLKNNLSLETTFSNYDLIHAKTISRNKMYWYSNIIIDKGSNDGIKEGDSVVTKDGFIGSIYSVSKNYSTVKLITSNANSDKISVTINSKTKPLGVIDSFKYPYIKIILSNEDKSIKKGDLVVTSSFGSSVKNLKIGKIEKISKDDYGLSYIVYVLPEVNFNDITYVGVLKQK